MMEKSIQVITNKIEATAKRAGRKPHEIQLIAVSKTYPIAAIEEAMQYGCQDFGENKVQELMSKVEQIGDQVNWHLIGHLQTNKVKYVIGHVALIHSVDRMRLIDEIQKQASKKDVVTEILLEVNVAQEDSKHGFCVVEVPEVAAYISQLSHVRLKGLMTVAPYVENPEDNRQIFKDLRQLSVDIQKQNMNNIDMATLSMGMSNDYEVAIEEGATMVRIGTAIFGERNYER
ncbi:MAG: YggS family pyridoxal phosphate-dependent enzyme [Cellulosilyticaceae bacterium]